ncbi:MAG: hypothetical protein LBG65_03595 [Puniceicoccales bacterium]|nr:hypothetical protein [Puniceicoccales bacterium]
MNKTTIATLSSFLAVLFAGTTVLFWHESNVNEDSFKSQRERTKNVIAERDAALDSLARAAREIDACRQDSAEVRRNLATESRRRAESEALAQNSSTAVSSLQQEKDRLRKLLDAANERLAAAVKEAEEAKAFAAEAHENEDNAVEQREAVSASLDESRRRIDEQSADIASLRTRLDALGKEAESLRAANARARSGTEIGRLEARLEKAEAEIEKRDAEITRGNDKIRDLEGEVRELRDDLQKARQK